MPNFDPCLLHIPFKEWSDDSRERNNYYEIERWARRLKDCGSCSCGSSLCVELDVSGGNYQGGGTVDPYSYGFTGGSALSWDNANSQFVVNEDGLYAVSSAVFNLIAWGTATYWKVTLGRNDRADAQAFCADTDALAGWAGLVSQLFPTMPAYPMPAGSTWGWNLTLAGTKTLGFSEFVVTKVNCCTIPAGPPLVL